MSLRPRSYAQYAALPFKFDAGDLKVLLITSRDTGRWIFPKGWPERKMKPFQVAEMEAFEEAGVRGEIEQQEAVTYHYKKRLKNGRERPCLVKVFLLHVTEELDIWPECMQRQREWCSPGDGALRIGEAELVTFLLGLSLPEP